MHCTIRGGLLLSKVSVKPVTILILNVSGARFSFGSALQGLKVKVNLPIQTGIKMDVNPGGCLLFGLISDANKYLKVDITLDFWISIN